MPQDFDLVGHPLGRGKDLNGGDHVPHSNPVIKRGLAVAQIFMEPVEQLVYFLDRSRLEREILDLLGSLVLTLQQPHTLRLKGLKAGQDEFLGHSAALLKSVDEAEHARFDLRHATSVCSGVPLGSTHVLCLILDVVGCHRLDPPGVTELCPQRIGGQLLDPLQVIRFRMAALPVRVGCTAFDPWGTPKLAPLGYHHGSTANLADDEPR
jgi:hypothetical protein